MVKKKKLTGRKFEKISTINLSNIEIYKLVLCGKIYSFPRYFWEKPDSLEAAKEITIYLIEELLNWSEDDIKINLNQKTFRDNKLGGMLKQLFEGSPYRAINNAYPNVFKPWELKISPNKLWNRETAYDFIKWTIEEKYKWNDEEVKENFSKTFLVSLGYDAAMDCVEEDTFRILDKLYPNRFKPWELKQVSISYWNEKTMGEALRWLIEDKLKIDIEHSNIKISNEFIEENGLGRLCDYIYKKKIPLYDLINMAYPKKYEEWEISNMDIWTDEKRVEAVKWLVEDKLKLDPEVELSFVRARHFKVYNLLGLLKTFGNSPQKALEFAYLENKNK